MSDGMPGPEVLKRGHSPDREDRSEGSRRSDDGWSSQLRFADALLAGRATAAVYYRYRNNHSNVAVFDFDRQVVGTSITMDFE